MRKFIYLFIFVAICLFFVKCEQQKPIGQGSSLQTGMAGNYAYVDLGLSSVCWATCNIGATKPEDYGDYFAWGEVEVKDSYNWDTYKYGSSEKTLSKYCFDSDYGVEIKLKNNSFRFRYVDSIDVLQNSLLTRDSLINRKMINRDTIANQIFVDSFFVNAIDDVAASKWAKDSIHWRMPTDAEMTELRTKCTWKWTTLNGVYGYTVSGNGKSIFLPAAGYKHEKTLSCKNEYGYYWSSSLSDDDSFEGAGSYGAYYLDFYAGGYKGRLANVRCYGLSVRPVIDRNKLPKQPEDTTSNNTTKTF